MEDDNDTHARALLREGGALARAGDHGPAVHVYASAGRAFLGAGCHLRAIAAFEQVRHIIRKRAPQELALDGEVRAMLPALYRRLGLEAEARAVEDESRVDRP